MHARRTLLLALFALAPAAVPARALSPYLVEDIDSTFRSGSSFPDRFVRVGQRVVFTATTPGRGLWSTDGTAGGTVPLLRNQAGGIETVAATGELLFAVACNGHRCQLEATDGTLPGTRALIGMPGSFVRAAAVAGPRRIFFTRADAATGEELWTSDGTVPGTRRVKDLKPGPQGSSPRGLTWLRDRLFFFALDGLWTSDGSTAGTRRIAALGADPTGLGPVAGGAGTRILFFAPKAGGTDFRLWSSDGTAGGTTTLGSIAVPAELRTLLAPFATAGANAFFFLPDEQSYRLFVSDGTAARTKSVASFERASVNPQMVVAGPRVGFVATDAAHGQELWASDGRPAGTGALDICPGTCSGYRGFLSDPFADGAGKVWFSGQAAAEGAELWISDLTRPGTREVEDLAPGFFSSDPHDFLAVDRRVFFVTGVSHDDEAVWVSDGRAAGTRRLAGPAGADRFLNVGFGAALAGRAVFRLDDGVHGAEPWISSGTVAGTALVADLEPAQLGGSRPQALTRVGDRCFFFTTLPDVEEAHELWV
ncbi:MAG TPA: hypothetical protein VN783_15680, partial [Thermoanaerobaculia bacterium]|nr:hypothetical protein [Thermoanaerobaculia bacterium]